jgi:hypothetical protein
VIKPRTRRYLGLAIFVGSGIVFFYAGHTNNDTLGVVSGLGMLFGFFVGFKTGD